jgi:hypothetical protein
MSALFSGSRGRRNRVVAHALGRFGVLTALVLLPTVAAQAVAPIGQTVPNPSASATLNSVIQVVNDGAGAQEGSGSVIDKFTITRQGVTTGYFCFLTAHHVTDGGLGTSISFLNGDPPALASRFNIIGTFLFSNATGTADLVMGVARYGTPDAFFNGVTPLSILAASPAVGSTFSQIGFGDTATVNGNGTMTQANGNGIKRYQNNNILAKPIIANNQYRYAAIEFDFTIGAGAVAGEGFSRGGDSGGPYLSSSGTSLDPDGAGPLPAISSTDGIFGGHTLGVPGATIVNGDVATGVDVTVFRADIINTCAAVQVALATAPEPSSVALILGIATLPIASMIRKRRRNA